MNLSSYSICQSCKISCEIWLLDVRSIAPDNNRTIMSQMKDDIISDGPRMAHCILAGTNKRKNTEVNLLLLLLILFLLSLLLCVFIFHLYFAFVFIIIIELFTDLFFKVELN